MTIDVEAVKSNRIISLMVNHLVSSKKTEDSKKEFTDLSEKELKDIIKKEVPEFELEEVIDGLKKIASASEIINKRVKLRINKEINRVIITVMKKNTNEIIKEIPCKEIQNLAVHLKEAIGILFDKTA